jgi:hypothetical protein
MNSARCKCAAESTLARGENCKNGGLIGKRSGAARLDSTELSTHTRKEPTSAGWNPDHTFADYWIHVSRKLSFFGQLPSLTLRFERREGDGFNVTCCPNWPLHLSPNFDSRPGTRMPSLLHPSFLHSDSFVATSWTLPLTRGTRHACHGILSPNNSTRAPKQAISAAHRATIPRITGSIQSPTVTPGLPSSFRKLRGLPTEQPEGAPFFLGGDNDIGIP